MALILRQGVRKHRNKCLGFLLFLFLCCLSCRTVEARVSQEKPKEMANIVLFAHFSGDNAEEDAAWFADKTNRDNIISYYEGSTGRSFSNYIDAISYGKLKVHNIFPQDNGTGIESYCLSLSAESARKGNVDGSIIEELIRAYPSLLEGKEPDYDGDGYIDNLTVILKGQSEEESAVNTTMVPHKSDYTGEEQWQGKRIGTYNMINTWQLAEKEMAQQSGVIAHEFLHSVGYLDLYTKDGSSYPVSVWDIMASTSFSPSYPLAYLRMHVSNWIELETITESCTLTLDRQDNPNGNQAYILRSPLNEQEVFVIEFRKKTYNIDSPERFIGGSGIIVYRVNTSLEHLSNFYGKTGVYVFRPQKGQNGYSGSEISDVYNAFLSAESGRTEIGTADMGKTLEDGALTFTDGRNSGIIIRNVSGSEGDSMTCEVIIPEETEFDLWEDTGFLDPVDNAYENKNVAVAAGENGQYMITYSNKSAQAYEYTNGQWKKLGAGFQENSYMNDVKLLSEDGGLYVGYISGSTYTAVLKKFDFASGMWEEIGTAGKYVSGFDMGFCAGQLHFVYVTGEGAFLNRWNGSDLDNLGQYYEGDMGGQPKLCEVSGNLYVAVRNAVGNIIEISEYQGAKTFRKITDSTFSANNYDLLSLNGRVYAVLDGEGLCVHSYDGNLWSFGEKSGFAGFDMQTGAVQGVLYVLLRDSAGDGKRKLYNYNIEKDSYAQEGVDVDSASDRIGLSIFGNDIYISYVRSSDNQILVKRKKITYSNPDYITMEKTSLKLHAGGREELVVLNGTGSRVESSGFSWSSSDASVASVDRKGNVKALNSGTVLITARSVNGNSVSCKVTVEGHSYQTVTLKATLTKNGSTVKRCTVCKAEKDASVIYYPKQVKLSASSYTYNGKSKKPSVIVKDSKGQPVSSSNYSVVYSSGRKRVGRYTVKIVMKGNYTGTAVKTFDIRPKTTSILKLAAGKKSFTAKWKKQVSQTTGYQVQYSTVKNFKKGVKTATVGKTKTTSKKISKLKSKKRYYVRIRTYKTVKIKGKSVKLYSSWSKYKQVKTK